jgi:hypothetical protein
MGNRKRCAADVIALYQSLSPSEQARVRTTLLEGLGGSPGSWITLEEAAFLLEKSKSQVSRDVKSGKLISNGKKGSAFRILRSSVAAMAVDMALQDVLAAYRIESDEASREILREVIDLLKRAAEEEIKLRRHFKS